MIRSARSRFVLRVAAAYAILATLWIFFSDMLLGSIIDPSLVAALGTAKGVAFVIVTTGLLVMALRRAPKENPATLVEAKAWPWPQTLIACALMAGIAVIAGAIYRVQSTALRDNAYVELQAVAKLKATGVAHWMDERRANARVLAGDAVFLDTLARWRHYGDHGDELRLRDVLRRFRTTYGFENVVLLDVQGLQLLGDGRILPAQTNLGAGIQAALGVGDVTFLDLSREQGGNAIHMAFLAPMYAGQGTDRELLGIALFDMRPQNFLYPYLLSWPLPSASGEILLFRAEGDNVVILNELRHRQDTALNVRIPLSNTQLPAARYVNDHEHLIEGVDYRGVRVLAAAISVPDTPWSMIVKVDRNEALGWARLLGLVLGIMTLLGLAASAAVVGYLWQRQRLRAALYTIAERQAGEMAEERFRATFEQAAVGIGHVARDGRYLRVNACLCRMLGFTREELLTKNVRDVIFAEDLPQALRNLEDALSDGAEEYTGERRYRRKDGEIIWVEATVSLTRGSDEQSPFFIVVATDITNRKRIEQALQDSEERFSLAMEGANDGLWDWDLLTNTVYYSPRWKSMLGYAEAELPGTLETWRDLIDPGDLVRVDAQVADIVAGRSEHFEIECRMRHKDGHHVDVLSRGFPVRREDGRAIRLVGTHVDISERKQAEDRLRQAAIVFTSSQEGVVITDPRGNIKAVNPAFCTITGYGDAELLGQNMRVLQSGRHGKEFYTKLWGSVAEMGYWQGEIWNRRKNGELFPELLTISSVRDENGQVVAYVGSFTDITGIKQSEAQLEKLAHHDPLTGLPNRLLLRSRLDHAILRAIRTGKPGAVLFLDLDRFKTVNDSLGHPAGDELLLAVARRLTDRLRETDTIARLGGDEFIILLEDIAGADSAANVSQILIDQLSQPFALKDAAEVYIGASIGISLFPDDSHDSDSLIQQADSALYQAKEDGRGVYRFYTAALTEAANTRLVLEARLRRALERNEFVLHYQPLISIPTRRVLGVEALMRWQDPERGMISPAQFIPLAEETGGIIALGAVALRVACRQMKAWLDAGLELETMAVNLSPRQFRQPDIQDQVRNILAETGLPPRYLELEITEGAIMEQGLEAEGKLEWFRELGIRVAIDDFGTGYSSLAYLKRFRINKLKVDQSFVRNIAEGAADMEIAAAIIGLGKTLGLEVLAEGVETAAQLAFLEGKGCDAAQGYLFSRPVPAEQIPNLVQRHGGVRGAA